MAIRRVVGHSMVPVLPPGTWVIGLSYIDSVKPGQVVIVQHEGKEKIRRVSEVKNNRIFILGDHPETSIDSRHFGWLPMKAVRARVVWPRSKAIT